MTRELPSISVELPNLVHCKQVNLGTYRVLIHAPGFEDRTMAVVDLVSASAGSRAILLKYLPHNDKNRLVDVRSGLLSKGVHVADEDVLLYDRFLPDDFEQRLAARLRAMDARSVVIDISTMSKLTILLALRTCTQLGLDVDILYTEAEKYGPTKEEFEEARDINALHQPSLQIFTGVHGVVRVNSLASVAMQGQPTAALVFMSFNDSLTQVLLNTVYPTRLLLINGRPPVHTWREEATAWIHEQVRREWADDNPIVENSAGRLLPRRTVSTLDYRETTMLLISLYWELSAEYRILLAPAGSKMQAVGCFFAKTLHPDIHIEYPSPEGFLPEYSSGICTSWMLSCGKITELMMRLQGKEYAEFLEVVV